MGHPVFVSFFPSGRKVLSIYRFRNVPWSRSIRHWQQLQGRELPEDRQKQVRRENNQSKQSQLNVTQFSRKQQ